MANTFFNPNDKGASDAQNKAQGTSVRSGQGSAADSGGGQGSQGSYGGRQGGQTVYESGAAQAQGRSGQATMFAEPESETPIKIVVDDGRQDSGNPVPPQPSPRQQNNAPNYAYPPPRNNTYGGANNPGGGNYRNMYQNGGRNGMNASACVKCGCPIDPRFPVCQRCGVPTAASAAASTAASAIRQAADIARSVGREVTQSASHTFDISDNESFANGYHYDSFQGCYVDDYSGRPLKNKTLALLLSIFFGYLGVHRFYEGKIFTGILYAITGGLFTIGWIVDIIRIATKKKKYYDPFQ